jgi:hypothetical protein
MVGKTKREFFKEHAMRRYLMSLAAGSLALIGLAGSPSLARADHHGGHHAGWHHDHRGWDHDWHRWRGYYTPYPSYYAAPYYGYTYPYSAPYYVYPGYGIGYWGPHVSFWLGR